ncbi:MAG: ATP-grasp domain-containing protein [Bacteroides sp.]|nr:ATP-grasp domain-containing protein [Bacteroides sp.]
MGVYTVVTSLTDNYPCIPLADKIYRADILNPQDIFAVAEKENVDGVIICCSDTGLHSVGYVCDQLNLVGLTEKSAEMSSDKLLMKESLMNKGVRTARFKKVKDHKELANLAKELELPLIVKATDLQGSKGIYIVKDIEQLESAFEKAMNDTRRTYCIVEEYIEGREFGAQSFVYNNEVLFVLPHGDEIIVRNTAVPVGHYLPYEIDSNLQKDIIEQATRAIEALGLNNCAVNIDFIEKEGKAYIIELTGRAGANCLTELTSNYFGIDYYEMILTMALGGDPREIFDQRRVVPKASLSKMIISDRVGKVSSIHVPERIGDTAFELFIEVGSEVRSFTNSNDVIGQVITIGDSMQDCHEKLNAFLDEFSVTFE